MQAADARRRLGSTSLEVTRLGFGGAPLGGLYRKIGDAEADATLAAAWAAGVRFFDTAPWYGRGLSEHRVGDFLRRQPAGTCTLSTKVGRLLRPAREPSSVHPAWADGLPFDVVFDYSRDGLVRSFEDSLQRLGLSHAEAVLVHDLEPTAHRPQVAFRATSLSLQPLNEAYLSSRAPSSGRACLPADPWLVPIMTTPSQTQRSWPRRNILKVSARCTTSRSSPRRFSFRWRTRQLRRSSSARPRRLKQLPTRDISSSAFRLTSGLTSSKPA